MREIRFRMRTKTGDKIWHYFEYPVAKSETALEMYDLDSFTQFTGLLDKNGKEIYEGDIVKDGKEIFGVVYHNILASFVGTDRRGLPLGSFPREDWEIIGNIYENPDLLTPTKE